MQAGVAPVVENHRKKLDRKLSKIRNIYTAAAAENNEFQLSRGSRKIIASGYKKKPNNGEVLGAPFPKYLREVDTIALILMVTLGAHILLWNAHQQNLC